MCAYEVCCIIINIIIILTMVILMFGELFFWLLLLSVWFVVTSPLWFLLFVSERVSEYV